MMLTIWKYPLSTDAAHTDLSIPKGGRVLTVQFQDHLPFIWVQVDTEKPPTMRHFELVATGQQIFPDALYIGTIQRNGMVFHLYEVVDAAQLEDGGGK